MEKSLASVSRSIANRDAVSHNDEVTRRADGRRTELIPGESARTRLILAAERLFAEHGIAGASLREIASRAGQGNHFAVQYHFGSREGLVRALFDHRMEQMEATRGAMLAKAEMEGRLGDARALLEIILLPQLDLQDADGNHSYALFLAQFLLRSRSTVYGDFGGENPPHLLRALDLLRQRLGHLPDAAAQRRLVGGCLTFLNILVSHSGEDAASRGEDFAAALDDTLEQIVAGLCMSFA